MGLCPAVLNPLEMLQLLSKWDWCENPTATIVLWMAFSETQEVSSDLTLPRWRPDGMWHETSGWLRDSLRANHTAKFTHWSVLQIAWPSEQLKETEITARQPSAQHNSKLLLIEAVGILKVPLPKVDQSVGSERSQGHPLWLPCSGIPSRNWITTILGVEERMKLRNVVTFHVLWGEMCRGVQKETARRGKEIRFLYIVITLTCVNQSCCCYR